ncbi:MAG: TerD family protein [Verrucomicrobiaceae bacterium]|nr:MAG: TerD family protein [Verrucomicrobiaceae bacterium]
MGINLIKGQTIDLRKDANDLDRIVIGLGWKIREKKNGFFDGLLGKKDDAEFDLDAIAFILNGDGKVGTLGNEKLENGDVIFFNNRRHPSGLVYHSGDNRVGGSGDQDDEQIVVRLNALPPVYSRILFLVSIYKGIEKKQHFGQVASAYIRAVDGKGKEMARYQLNQDPAYGGKCLMVFGEVYRRDSGWKFRALGDAHATDSFIPLLKQHLA